MKNTTVMALAALMTMTLATVARAFDPVASDPERVEAARQLFDRMVALERSYSPELAALFAPSARIEIRSVAANGDVKTLHIPGPAHRASLRLAHAVAEAQGDRGSYTDVTYVSEGGRVRISAERLADVTRKASHVSLLVGPDATSRWVVWEQISESRP